MHREASRLTQSCQFFLYCIACFVEDLPQHWQSWLVEVSTYNDELDQVLILHEVDMDVKPGRPTSSVLRRLRNQGADAPSSPFTRIVSDVLTQAGSEVLNNAEGRIERELDVHDFPHGRRSGDVEDVLRRAQQRVCEPNISKRQEASSGLAYLARP